MSVQAAERPLELQRQVLHLSWKVVPGVQFTCLRPRLRQAICVQMAAVPSLLQVQVLQSFLNDLLGVHCWACLFTMAGSSASLVVRHALRVQPQMPVGVHVHVLQSCFLV